MKLKRDFLDAAFSDFIRWRDRWTCRRCGTSYAPPTNALHSAHIYTRGCPSIRHDEENAIALCHGCHSYFTGRPIEFRDWCYEKLGEKHMESLRFKYYARSTKLTRSEKQLLAEDFRNKIKEIQALTVS